MNRRSVLALSGAAFLASAPFLALEARAPDLTIQVPVQVTKLHLSVDGLWLNCRLYDQAGVELALDSIQTTPRPPNGVGGFNGTLESVWAFSKPSDYTAPKKFKCKLQVRGGPGTPLRDLVDGDGSQYYHLKPGTPRTLTAEGPIP